MAIRSTVKTRLRLPSKLGPNRSYLIIIFKKNYARHQKKKNIHQQFFRLQKQDILKLVLLDILKLVLLAEHETFLLRERDGKYKDKD